MPEIEEKNRYLSKLNSHPFDARIQFFDDGHIYEVDGQQGYTSVTTVVSKFHEHFNKTNILKKMRASGKLFREGQRYHGMTDDDIEREWSENGRRASEAGTKMHYNIECFYNNNPFQDPEMMEIKKHFLNFQREHVEKQGLIPYRTEMFVFDENRKIAGSIDMLFTDTSGNLYIYDWKRVKELKETNPFAKMKHPFGHYDDCNYIHYSVQLNIYRRILESVYEKNIAGMCLVVLHEENEDFIVKSVPFLEKEMDVVMDSLLLQTQRSRA